jgi:hypothetical protein
MWQSGKVAMWQIQMIMGRFSVHTVIVIVMVIVV